MSVLLGNGTLANLNTPYYSGGGGGGGGPNLVVSTITSDSAVVSSITAAPGNNGLSLVGDVNGILLDGAAGGVFINGAGLFFPTASAVDFQATNGAITGLSSVNGAAYPPAAPANSGMTSFNILNSGNNYVPAGGTTTPLASFSTTQFHLYQLELPYLRVQNEPVGVPQAGAWADLSIDTAVNTTYLDTFDMASVSTIANDLQKAAVYSFVASGASHTLSATGNLGNTLSTAITTLGKGYLKDLGNITTYPSAN